MPTDPSSQSECSSSLPLDGRVVLVTGAARGLGRHIAAALACAGADLAVTAREADALAPCVEDIHQRGRRALPLELDLTDRPGIAPMVDAVIQEFGRIDVLVCNSGVGGPTVPVQLVSDDDWDETLAVNLTGAFLCARSCVQHMVRAQSGVVLFIGSMTGKRPLMHRAPYATSKMALVGLCRTMALELGPHNVRVNLLSPGFVEGERLDWVVDAEAAALGRPIGETRLAMQDASPLRRFTAPRDVAQTAVFLASDAAAGITGEDINVSSGAVMY